jgi:branched-chain amino acid transport system substrate-binding protein
MYATVSSAKVKIGIEAPVGGTLQSVGVQMKYGADAAVADLNASGGVNGEQIVLDSRDAPCDVASAVASAESFGSEKVGMVVGYFCGDTFSAVDPVYAASNTIVLSLNHARGGERPGAFVLAPSALGLSISAFASRQYPTGEIFVVARGTTSDAPVAREIRDALVKGGRPDAKLVSFDDAIATKLVGEVDGTTPKVVIFVGGIDEVSQLSAALSADTMDAHLIWGDADPSAFAMSFGSLVSSFDVVAPRPIDSYDLAAEFVSKARKGGFEPTSFAIFAYAAVEVWAKAAEAQGTFDPSDVTKALTRPTGFDSVLGHLRFETGTAPRLISVSDWAIYRWQEGKLVLVGLADGTPLKDPGGQQDTISYNDDKNPIIIVHPDQEAEGTQPPKQDEPAKAPKYVVGEQEQLPELPDDSHQLGCNSASPEGATTFSPRQFPEVLRLDILLEGTEDPQICTGTLIAERWVLTAAHCLTTKGSALKANGNVPGDYVWSVPDAELGRRIIVTAANSLQPPPFNRRYGEKAVLNAGYKNTGEFTHDVALVRLADPTSGSQILSTIL